MNNENNVKIDLYAPLSKYDSESQTFGCRANNPNICAYCDISELCAFTSIDKICKKPTRAWKKVYNELRNAK